MEEISYNASDLHGQNITIDAGICEQTSGCAGPQMKI
ncbi:heat shock protein [Salmonella enterica subsp. enterica]|uniref:Heat shock protein n=1 Tax=Salmonella enterica I TaxID=59201 RepID=A0A447TQL2_SALET|nr:heat shock protein [Salmonella enterica subsp. enterica]